LGNRMAKTFIVAREGDRVEREVCYLGKKSAPAARKAGAAGRKLTGKSCCYYERNQTKNGVKKGQLEKRAPLSAKKKPWRRSEGSNLAQVPEDNQGPRDQSKFPSLLQNNWPEKA